MFEHPNLPPLPRHARLFELIRQRNLAEAVKSRPQPRHGFGEVDELIFLKRAENSFRQPVERVAMF